MLVGVVRASGATESTACADLTASSPDAAFVGRPMADSDSVQRIPVQIGNPAVEIIPGELFLYRIPPPAPPPPGSARSTGSAGVMAAAAAAAASAAGSVPIRCLEPESAAAAAVAAAPAALPSPRSQPPPPPPRIPEPDAGMGVGAGVGAGADAMPPPPLDAAGVGTHSRLLCALSVPAHVSVADFCAFFEPYQPKIAHIRIVADPQHPQQYVALLRLTDETAAADLVRDYNGRPYSSLEEAEVCCLVPLAGAVFAHETSVPDSYTELPTCAVCLDRLDASVTGLLTTLCNHTFHSRCIRQWAAGTCPVCRFDLEPSDAQPVCMECGRRDNLWICLVCGHVGCGRCELAQSTDHWFPFCFETVQGHAKEHFERTKHTYALEAGTQRVWDYAGDGYVHRLLNSVDGKVVEHGKPGDDKSDEKLVEATYTLLSQLEAQREYFEERLAAMQRERDAARQAAGSDESTERKLRAVTKQLATLQQRSTRESEEFAFLKQLNESLMRDIDRMRREHAAELQARDRRIAELEEQVRDLMVYLDTQQRVQASPLRDELAHGQVVLGPAPAPSPPSGGRARSGRRR